MCGCASVRVCVEFLTVVQRVKDSGGGSIFSGLQNPFKSKNEGPLACVDLLSRLNSVSFCQKNELESRDSAIGQGKEAIISPRGSKSA